MHREAIELRMMLRLSLAFAAALAALVCAQPAVGALSDSIVEISGPGTREQGRAIDAQVTIVNSPTKAGQVPEAISKLTIDAGDLRVAPTAVRRCRATPPSNGDPIDCPADSKVGSGSVAGFLGTPGRSSTEFGSLSAVRGRITVFNLSPDRGRARVAIQVESARPFRGTAINLTARFSRSGIIEIQTPKLAELPGVIRRSYPADTQLVISRLRLRIGENVRQIGSRPYLSLKRRGVFGVGVRTTLTE